MSLLKKFAAATLALTMTLSLAACGGSDAPAADSNEGGDEVKPTSLRQTQHLHLSNSRTNPANMLVSTSTCWQRSRKIRALSMNCSLLASMRQYRRWRLVRLTALSQA